MEPTTQLVVKGLKSIVIDIDAGHKLDPDSVRKQGDRCRYATIGPNGKRKECLSMNGFAYDGEYLHPIRVISYRLNRATFGLFPFIAYTPKPTRMKYARHS